MHWASEFLSTPSARRATQLGEAINLHNENFYPRPPRGGRRSRCRPHRHPVQFLSTPSARRATRNYDYWPRLFQFLSTPSARRATRGKHLYQLRTQFLSTPSARRATYKVKAFCKKSKHFYPRPPRGGRRGVECPDDGVFLFLSTPSARRATLRHRGKATFCGISIHALREEGDTQTPFRPHIGGISIHALREEGDDQIPLEQWYQTNFYPRPPRGGRHSPCVAFEQGRSISIHALREEGDGHCQRPEQPGADFYPRPPRGGRPGACFT